jgi:hypothetical protein
MAFLRNLTDFGGRDVAVGLGTANTLVQRVPRPALVEDACGRKRLAATLTLGRSRRIRWGVA